MVISRASMPKQISKGRKKKTTGKMRKKRKTAYKISYKHYAKSRKRKKNLESVFTGSMLMMPLIQGGMSMKI